MTRTFFSAAILAMLTACGSSGGNGGGGGASATGGGGTGGAGGGTGGAGALGGAAGSGGNSSSSTFAAPQVMAAKQTNSFRVAIAGGRVFWNGRGEPLVNAPGGLFSVPVAGGSVTTHVSSPVYAVKADSGRVYYADDAGIHGMKPDGSDQKVVAAIGSPAIDFAIGGGYVWWGLAGQASPVFGRAPLAGGAIEPLPLSAPQVTVGYLAANDQLVFAQMITYGDPFIFQVSTSDLTNSSQLLDNVLLTQMALDDSFLYLGMKAGPQRLPLAGGDPESLGSLESVAAIAVEPHAAYVTSDPSLGCLEGAGQVHRIDLDTKEMKLIADGQTCPSGVQVDASGVWWVNAGTNLDPSAKLNDPETGALMFAKRL